MSHPTTTLKSIERKPRWSPFKTAAAVLAFSTVIVVAPLPEWVLILGLLGAWFLFVLAAVKFSEREKSYQSRPPVTPTRRAGDPAADALPPLRGRVHQSRVPGVGVPPPLTPRRLTNESEQR